MVVPFRRPQRPPHGPRVVFDGYYGMRNTGDDAFCAVAADIASTRWAASSIAFLAPSSALPVMSVRAIGVFPDPPRFRGHGRLGPLPAMLKAGHVVHVGGSTFMQPLTRHRDQSRLAQAGLLNLHAVGVSIGPFRDAQSARTVERSLQRFRSVSVRDAASAERLSDLGSSIHVTRAFDVAMLLGTAENDEHRVPVMDKPNRPVLGVTLCAHEAKRGGDARQEESRVVRTAAVVNEVVRRTGAVVRVLIFNDHPYWGDHDVSEQFASLLDGSVEFVPRSVDPLKMLEEIRSCDALIATRLHSAVFAFASGVPFAIVAYQQKGIDFAAELGLADALIFPASGPDPSQAGEIVVALLEGRGLPPRLAVAEATARALSAFPAQL